MAAEHQKTTFPLLYRAIGKNQKSRRYFLPSTTTEPNVSTSILATKFNFPFL